MSQSLDNNDKIFIETYTNDTEKFFDIRDPTTNQLLFRYCPKTQQIEIKPKNGSIRVISLKPYHR